ncbi:MAG: menaquinone biosynthesis protein [Candidatus Eremiobacteraeota bacterium]|nr:menaquinone biosynthesis protein [Candidatus Eremiobacteraeota bacterium]MBC5804198.1 menaquinone biosynthesis protein [Candidatus Eremiobacteraeota bacterium]MBC5822602.1 menaquinone biosynthesis protein [Candidatus Eremiobacteraeota bacterium]
MLRTGRIAYTNDLPIYAAFDAGAVEYPATLVPGVPSALNRMLLDGDLDLSPVSAFHWAGHADELALLPELCIGARTAVWSVLCISPKPLEELGGATVAVTRESESGRSLLRLLLARRYGVGATFVESADPFAAAARGEPALLIGDRALDARATFPPGQVHDLASLWHQWTGCDMVFAVWAVRKDVLARRPGDVHAVLDALLAARGWGRAHLDAVISLADTIRARPPGFYARYYQTLNFTLDEGARAGLSRYVHELHGLGAIPSAPSVEPEVALAAR